MLIARSNSLLNLVQFVNESTGERINTKVTRVSHYNSTRKLFESEGLSHSSSKPKNIGQAITNLESLTGSKENIKKHGVWAIEFVIL